MTTRVRPRRGDPALDAIAVLALGLYVLFIIVPLIMSAWKSLTDENPLLAPSRFVGVTNYTDRAHDYALAASLGFPLVTAGAVTAVANAAGIGFALLLNRTSLSFRMMR